MEPPPTNDHDHEPAMVSQAAFEQGRRSSSSSLLASSSTSIASLARRRASSFANAAGGLAALSEPAKMTEIPASLASPPGAPPDFVANHHRYTTPGSKPARFFRSSGSSKRTSEEDVMAEEPAEGAPIPSPTMSASRGWIARRNGSAASKSSHGSQAGRPTDSAAMGKQASKGRLSRAQSGTSRKSSRRLPKTASQSSLGPASPVDLAIANSRRSPLPRGQSSDQLERRSREFSSRGAPLHSSVPSLRHEARDVSVRSHASSDSQYSLNSVSAPARSASAGGSSEHDGVMVPARASSMRASQTVRSLRPLEALQQGSASPPSSTSSYPTSPVEEHFARQPSPTAGFSPSAVRPEHPPGVGELGRAESSSEYFTPLPVFSPLSLGILQGTGNAAREARSDQHFQSMLTTERDPFDRAVPAWDLAAELQGRQRSGSTGTRSDKTRRDEGLSPVAMQASRSQSSKRSHESDNRPSPSPSEDARRLADVYGMYDIDDEPASESQEHLTSEVMEAKGTGGSRHAREPAQVGAADIFKHEVVDVDDRPPLARSQVLDELEAMLGQAMEDAQRLNLEGADLVSEGISPTGGNRISIATSGAYEDAPDDDASFERGAPELLDTPLAAEPTQGLALFTGEPVSEAPASESSTAPLKTPTGSDPSASPVSVHPLAMMDPPARLQRARTASTISSPPSPTTPRHRPVLAARPATIRSSSLIQHTEWQAQQHRQALAAEKLRRVRPLPAAMDYSDVKRLRTSADRAKAYAIKINALVKEDTGIDLWLDRMREQRSAQAQVTPTPSLRSPTAALHGGPAVRAGLGAHHPRDVSTAVSVVSFPMRPDASRAVEINHDSPAPLNLMHPSSLPFPGVYRPPLAPIPSGGSASAAGSQISPSNSQSTVASGKPSSFLTTLGRKASRRPGPGPRYSPPVDTSVARGPATAGPRGPRPSFVAATAAPRPTSAVYGAASTSPASANQSSFSYGQSPVRGRGKAFEESLDKLEDILPQVNRETLGHFLQQEGGDDLAAISAYLEAEKHGRI